MTAVPHGGMRHAKMKRQTPKAKRHQGEAPDSMLRHACLGNNNGCTRNYAGGARAARANVKQDSQVSHSQVLKHGKFDLVSGQVPMTSECILVPIQVPMFLGGTPSHLIAPNFGIAQGLGVLLQLAIVTF